MAQALLSDIRNLSRRKARRRRGLAVLEGARLIREAMEAGARFRGVIVRADSVTEQVNLLLEALGERAIGVEQVAAQEFDSVAATDRPQGIIAVAEHPNWTYAEIANGDAPILIVDAVQDPGNAGALIRTAYCLGASGVVMLDGAVDLLNPKVLRAAMGATYRMPVICSAFDGLRSFLRERGLEVWTGSAAGRDVRRMHRTGRVAIVVGNEGAGVRAEFREMGAKNVLIPLARGAESLNVAVAAGILLYEVNLARK